MPGPIETIFWMFAAIIKFVVTPSLMVGRGIALFPTILISSLGAAIGVLIFFYFGKWLFTKWDEWRGPKQRKGPVFTPGRRRFVRFRRRFGLRGLLIISGLISVPIASILAAKYHIKDARMPWLLIFAFLIWSVALTLASSLFSLGA